MAKRVTTAELGSKIDKLIDVLTAQAIAPAPVAAPAKGSPAEVAFAADAVNNTVQLDGAYLTHQKGKSQAHANDKGMTVILYCRVNKAGETKLAYSLEERYNASIINQPSHRGEVARFTPQS